MKTSFALSKKQKTITFLMILASSIALWLMLYNELHLEAQGPVSTLPCQNSVKSEQYISFYECNLPTKTATNFLADFGPALGIDDSTDAVQLIETKYGLSSIHSRYQQVLAGYPVFNAYVSVHQNSAGTISAIHSSYKAQLKVNSQKQATLSPNEAITSGQIETGITALRQPARPELVWYPLDDSTAVLAYQIMLYAEEPLGDFLTVVEAESGDILFQENRLAFDTGSGLVYQPNPYQTQGNGTDMVDNNDATNATLDAERVSVTLLGLDSGTGLLKGEFVDLATLNSTDPGVEKVDADEPSRIYNYDRDDPRFEQVVIYHSIDSIQRHFHNLGFDDDTGTPNGIRDFPTLANAHWYTQDQSFYSTGDDAVHFGDGGVDDGEDADIVAHEYGHAVQYNQNALWGGGQMGAMGEGFGDYLAASFYLSFGDVAFQNAHGACVGEWDATSYSGSNPPCLRRVDGNKMYPGDLGGGVHADGEIWSRALWDIRLALGPSADAIVLEHHFALPANATMPTAALAMLQADVDLNGGANDSVIRQAFCDRGILSGADCVSPTPDFSLAVLPTSQTVCTPNDALYTAQLTSLNNFADMVTLSASGAPTGSLSISPNPLMPTTPAATATLTFNSVITGNHSIDVVGIAPTATHTSTISLNIMSIPPLSATLLSPANGETGVILTPTLSWQATPNTTDYALEVAADAGFNTIVYSASVAGTSHLVSQELSPTTTFFWRVQPKNLCGSGNYSSVYSFTTTTNQNFSLTVLPASQTICTPNNAVYTAELTSINNFAGMVTLSTSGAPTGSVSINPNSLMPATPAATATLTISSVVAGNHNIDVIGISATATHTSTIALNILSGPPLSATLLTPTNGATDVVLAPMLSWQAAATANNYFLEIATDAGFNTIVYSASVAGTSHTVSEVLSPTTTFFWRLQPENLCGSGTYSSVFSFTTTADPDFSLNVLPTTQTVCSLTDASYTVELTAFNNFADMVTLNISGAPTGSVSISPNPLMPATPAATATLTLNSAITGSHSIDVIGVAPSTTHTNTITLDILAGTPLSSTLLAPANGATNLALTPTLSWQATPNTTDYALEVAADAGFNTIVYSTSVAGTSHAITAPLSKTTHYHWRVRPQNQCGAGSNSMAYSFSTGYSLFLPLILR